MFSLRSLTLFSLVLGSLLLLAGSVRASNGDASKPAPATEMPRLRARQLAAYLTDALDLTSEQSRQVERCTYAHLRQQQRTRRRLPGADRRAERHYLAALGRVLRPSQLSTYFWLADQQPMAVVRLSAPRF